MVFLVVLFIILIFVIDMNVLLDILQAESSMMIFNTEGGFVFSDPDTSPTTLSIDIPWSTII